MSGRLQEMARALRAAIAAREEAREAFEAAERHAARLEREEMPLAMEEEGVTAFTDAEGNTFTLTRDVEASVSAERMGEAYRWLHAHGYSEIVKGEAILSLRPGSSPEEILAACEKMDSLGLGQVTNKLSIHHATLKAFVKERLRKGEPLPLDTFAVRPFNIVKMKGKK
jgi:hypothetical protein